MKLYSKYAIALLSTLALVTSCKKDDAKYSVHSNHAYILQTETKGNTVLSLQVPDDPQGITAELNVRLTDVQDKDRAFKATLMSAEELAAYNKANETDYVILPKDYFQLVTSDVTVKAGAVISDAIKVQVKPITPEMVKSGEKYVVPVKLQSNDGMKIIKGGDEFLYVIKPVVETVVPVLGTDEIYGYRKGLAQVDKEVEVQQWTVEFRVNMSAYSKNNQAIFGSWGQDSEIYIRFGDASTPFNTLQVKFAGTQFDKSNTIFEPNKWYHVAVVYNGKNVALYVNGKKDLDTDKVSGRSFFLGKDLHVISGGSEYFRAQAMLHEVRVWGIARTPAQLVDSEFGVSPKTKGLIHYWKMDDGTGTTFKNSVEGGPEVKVLDVSNKPVSTVRWLKGVRSDSKTRTNFEE